MSGKCAASWSGATTLAEVKLTDSVFSRYNIGREKDVEAARKAFEQFHKQAQRKRKRALADRLVAAILLIRFLPRLPDSGTPTKSRRYQI